MIGTIKPYIDKIIKNKLDIELHPKYIFLVRKNGYYIDFNTFKKITKSVYDNSEESSTKICNYRFIKKDEWDEIKLFLEL